MRFESQFENRRDVPEDYREASRKPADCKRWRQSRRTRSQQNQRSRDKHENKMLRHVGSQQVMIEVRDGRGNHQQ
jgi:hypothetical protein